MRTLKLFALMGIFIAHTFTFAAHSNRKDAKTEESHLENFSYVVIGAFAIRDNALRMVSRAEGYKFHAHYELNQNRNLYYVYVLQTKDMGLAVAVAVGLREETQFIDAWVFKGVFTAGNSDTNKDINPMTVQPIIVKAADTNNNISPNPVEQPVTVTTVTEEPVQPKNESTESVPDKNAPADSKPFIFQLFRGSDNKIIEGDVAVIDVDRSRKMGSFKGNSTVNVPPPNSKSEKILAEPEVFGYRKHQLEIDFNHPQSEGSITLDEKNNYVVPLELVRLRKGDIAVMYNVFFYKDAGVMRPESKYEVNSLLEMLKENEKCRIRIHGHTNGNAAGKIISLEKGSTNYFSLTGTKEGLGSARQLSGERADVIRQYLINNGVKPERLEVKAWGGKRPIHEKTSSKAGENVRVEVEILAD